MGSKTISSTTPWLLYQFLSPGFCPILSSSPDFNNEQCFGSTSQTKHLLPKLLWSWCFVTAVIPLTRTCHCCRLLRLRTPYLIGPEAALSLAAPACAWPQPPHLLWQDHRVSGHLAPTPSSSYTSCRMEEDHWVRDTQWQNLTNSQLSRHRLVLGGCSKRRVKNRKKAKG